MHLRQQVLIDQGLNWPAPGPESTMKFTLTLGCFRVVSFYVDVMKIGL